MNVKAVIEDNSLEIDSSLINPTRKTIVIDKRTFTTLIITEILDPIIRE
jgi:hypothetical protein